MIHRSSFAALPFASVAFLLLCAACQSDSDEDSADDATPTVPAMQVAPARAQPGRPSPVPVIPPAAEPAAAEPAGVEPVAPEPPAAELPAAVSASTAVAQVFAACTHTEGSYGRNCDSIYLTMKQMSPPRCVQLTIDNCGEYSRSGLGVRLPMPWRVESGAVSSNLSRCELGAFYLDSTVAQRATGSVRWNDSGRLPTEIELDVTLDTSTSLSAPSSVALTTAEPILPSLCN